MNEKLYRREGRRFVPIDPQIPKPFVNNVGKYYQEDGSFVDQCTPKSIGLCILSNENEHIIMTLKGEYVDNYKSYIKRLPTIDEMFIAFFKFKKELNLKEFEDYKVILESYKGLFSFFSLLGVGRAAILRDSRIARSRFIIRIKN